jgi:hypothetical protein
LRSKTAVLMTVGPTQRQAAQVLAAPATRAMVFLLPIFKCPIVNIRDDCITLFNYTGNLCLLTVTNLNKTPVKCLLDETP